MIATPGEHRIATIERQSNVGSMVQIRKHFLNGLVKDLGEMSQSCLQGVFSIPCSHVAVNCSAGNEYNVSVLQ